MRKKRLLVGFLFILLFIGFTYFIKTVDVNKVGEQNVLVGFSYVNRIFSSIFRYNEFFYKLSNIFGYSAFAICAVYGTIGLIQLITRRDVRKVDEEILLLGFLYVTILIIYIVFNFVDINMRPVLIDGVLEPSYPSSHTFMALVVCGSAIIINKKKYNNVIARVFNYLCLVFMILIIVTRILSGAHWFTDIVGSIILSFAFLLIYSGLITNKE